MRRENQIAADDFPSPSKSDRDGKSDGAGDGESPYTAAEELHEIAEATNPDGTVTVTLVDWERSPHGEWATVWFETPAKEKRKTQMKWPHKASDEYRFVRIVREAGLRLNAAEDISGERIPAIVSTNGNWELAPEKDDKDDGPWPSRGQLACYTLLAPVTVVGSFVEVALGRRYTDDEWFHVAPAYAGVMLWMAAALVLLVIL